MIMDQYFKHNNWFFITSSNPKWASDSITRCAFLGQVLFQKSKKTPF